MCSEIFFLLNFTLERYITCYISIIKISTFFYLYILTRWAEEKKSLRYRYFALISLETDSPFNFTLKDMHSMWYIQTVFSGKLSTWWTPDLEVCLICFLRIFKKNCSRRRYIVNRIRLWNKRRLLKINVNLKRKY